MSANFHAALIIVPLALMLLLATQHITASVAFFVGWFFAKGRGGKFCLWLSTIIVGPIVVVLSCAWVLPQFLGEMFARLGLSANLGEGLGLFGAFFLLAAPIFVLAGTSLGELGEVLFEEQVDHDAEVMVKNRRRPLSYRKVRDKALWRANLWVFLALVIAQCCALFYTFG